MTINKGLARHSQRQKGGILFWALVVLIGAAIGAFVIFQLVMRNVELNMLVTDQITYAVMEEDIPASTTVLNELDITIDDIVSTRVPVDTVVSVPLNDPLMLTAHFDADVPISHEVRVQQVITIDQEIPIDTMVQAEILGDIFTLPIRGMVPVKAEVPIDILIPIDQTVAMKFTAPVKGRLLQDLEVPLKTTIVADVPLKTRMQVPVLNRMEAMAELDDDDPLKVKINYSDMHVPLHRVRFGFGDDEQAESATTSGEASP